MKLLEQKLKRYYLTSSSYYQHLKESDISFFTKYIEYLKPKIGERVLDFGCGVGQVVHKLTARGYQAYGVDISPIAIEQASEKGQGNFQTLKGKTLPFPDNFFGSVGCFNVLEHLSYPEHALKELVRILKPDGKIIITCPNFLRVMGIKGHHWHTTGIRQQIKNFYCLLRKIITAWFFLEEMHFDFMKPKLLEGNDFYPDADAICITNPIDVIFFLQKLSIKRVYFSGMTFSTNKILDRISEWPLVRMLIGGVFFVGIKKL